MLWAKYLPADGPDRMATPMALLPMSRRDRMILAVLGGAGAVLLLIAIAVGGWMHFRLSALDDYRAGYAIGASWLEDGAGGDCQALMTARYDGGSWPDRPGGWGEFAAGCRDGLAGEPEAAWYQLRQRLWATGGD